MAEPAVPYSLFDETKEKIRMEAIINVASVPQRSPFRYPGGKTLAIPMKNMHHAAMTELLIGRDLSWTCTS